MWGGRSFMLNSQTRSRIVLSARFIKNNVFDRPYATEHSYYRYHNRYITLGSLTFARENFISSNLIYQYGRIEDIPFGTLLELTSGVEINEFFRRTYTGMKVAGGRQIRDFGYLAGSVAAGGFLKDNRYEQGMVQFKSNYHSNLMNAGDYLLRQFIDLDYTIGIRRFTDEYISLSDESGIRGLISDSLAGTRRLAISFETVAFAPNYLFGFRFAVFFFADMGIIGKDNTRLIGNDFYSGFGIGVRIRNENLVFRTFQIRLAIYPTLPPGATWYPLYISSGKSFETVSFNPSPPDIINFH
jgi:hypothetical protein